MDKPIQDFSDCHAAIVSMFDDLTALARPQAPTPQRRDMANRVLDVFQDVVTAHHREEEAELFAAVLADAVPGEEHAKVESFVNRLVAEHRRVEGLYSQLIPALSAMANGDDAALDAAAVEVLVTDYRAHAQFEEESFLPLSQTILGRNSDHMAALGLALHIRHAVNELRHRFGTI
ncbi:MAG: hemerythrin domain-containing protein [Rubrivivax sp.]|nr:hemerythrin domain-containing protein [Rubrivivax sp.]